MFRRFTVHVLPSTVLAASVALAAAPAAAQQVTSTSPGGSSKSAGPLDKYVLLHPGPGTTQNGNISIAGSVSAATLVGNGGNLTGLNASNVTTGTLSDARLTANVALLAAVQTFTGVKTFAVAPSFSASGAPFTVSSSTKVANLNADLLDGLDSSSFMTSLPNPLVGVNATPGGFAIAGQTSAANGIGVYGMSSSSTVFGMGLAAASNFGPGTRSISYGGNYPGLEAFSTAGNGVTAYGALNGIEGHSESGGASGVYGENNWGGYGTSGRGAIGVWGDENTGGGVGVYGTSNGGYGVVSIGDTYVNNDLYVVGSKFGYVVDLIKNGDGAALEPGDVVEIVGYEPAIVGEIPVTVVRRATSARATAVLGPIDCAVAIEPIPLVAAQPGTKQSAVQPTGAVCPRRSTGSIAPGGYGNVVTLGSFRAIRVDSSFGPILAGDLLVASPTAGYAMSAADPRVGTVIGKALSDWNGGMGEIPVMVGSR